MEHANLYGNYLTLAFKDVYPSVEAFKAVFDEVGLTDDLLTSDNLTKIYTLLTAEYMNSHIANSDVNQFNFRLCSLIWQYGPTFLKKLEYQENIRALTIDELRAGSKAVHNHSYNPSTAPSTSTLEELTTVDDQNTTNYKKAKLDAYMQASEYLDSNFTKEFLSKFKSLFIKIAEPNEPLIYEVDY